MSAMHIQPRVPTNNEKKNISSPGEAHRTGDSTRCPASDPGIQHAGGDPCALVADSGVGGDVSVSTQTLRPPASWVAMMKSYRKITERGPNRER